MERKGHGNYLFATELFKGNDETEKLFCRNKQDAIEWGEKRIDKRIVADFIGTETTKDDQTFTPPSRRSSAESEDSMCEVM